MILAAGRGERMRPLTDRLPKPLLEIAGQPLIVWHLMALARAGIHDVVVNHAHLGALIEQRLGDGRHWGLRLRYSPEPRALETAGGIRHALPLLGEDPFLVVNGDVFTAFDFARAHTIALQMRATRLLAWCVLVANPDHHPEGDFVLQDGLLHNPEPGRRALTFSGLGIYRPELFASLDDGQAHRLAPLLRAAALTQQAAAERYDGPWTDVGTPERLAALDAQCRVAQEHR